ncbi:MAG: cobalt transport protein ATP-binding subunit, partial [Methanolobus sp. T82-4]
MIKFSKGITKQLFITASLCRTKCAVHINQTHARIGSRQRINMKPDTPVIELKNTSYFYASSKTKALDDASLRIYPGEKIALLGANGAGKSTLFKHLNGILKPASGQVLINGKEISRNNIREVRQTVGIVFQNPDDQILAPTVEQDVAFGPMNMGLP